MHPTNQIAENHTHISRSLFNEGMRAVESKTYKKETRKVVLILAALYAAVAAWLWYTGGSLVFLLGESIFLGALLFWLIIMLPDSRRRSKYKAMTQGADSIPERTIRFYQDQLSVTTNTKKETIISYTDISGWQETKNLYIINCKNNTHIMLDKNGFVIGDFDVIKYALRDSF